LPSFQRLSHSSTNFTRSFIESVSFQGMLATGFQVECDIGSVPFGAKDCSNMRQLMMALLLGVSGCSDSKDFTVNDDEGTICLHSAADSALEIKVTFPDCFSSSCSSLLDANCSVELSANEVRIHSHGVIETRGGTCTADCRSYSTTCSSGPMTPGAYVVLHGTQSKDVSLPVASQELFDPEEENHPNCDWKPSLYL